MSDRASVCRATAPRRRRTIELRERALTLHGCVFPCLLGMSDRASACPFVTRPLCRRCGHCLHLVVRAPGAAAAGLRPHLPGSSVLIVLFCMPFICPSAVAIIDCARFVANRYKQTKYVPLTVNIISAPSSVPRMCPLQAMMKILATINMLFALPLRNHIRKSYVPNGHN